MTAMLSGRDREKLVKILGLLASDKDGERAAAGWTAARMLRERGLDWDALIAPALPAPHQPKAQADQPPTSPASVWSKEITFLLRRPELLSEWEVGFMRSVATRLRLTPKQIETLLRIYDRVIMAEER